MRRERERGERERESEGERERERERERESGASHFTQKHNTFVAPFFVMEFHCSSFIFFRDFLDKDMSRTKVIITYLPPLLSLEDPGLEQFITRLALPLLKV